MAWGTRSIAQQANLTVGDCFGELPLLQLRPHEHSVMALDWSCDALPVRLVSNPWSSQESMCQERSEVWVIDRWQFKNILFKASAFV